MEPVIRDGTPTKSKTETLNELMVEVFRMNVRLLEHGDRLVEPLRLNSARWQLLGAVALAGEPLTAPQIAQAKAAFLIAQKPSKLRAMKNPTMRRTESSTRPAFARKWSIRFV